MQEFTALGTAGGMYHFRDQIRSGNTEAFFVMNGDVCADFPLIQLYEYHKQHGEKSLVIIVLCSLKIKSKNTCFGDVLGILIL